MAFRLFGRPKKESKSSSSLQSVGGADQPNNSDSDDVMVVEAPQTTPVSLPQQPVIAARQTSPKVPYSVQKSSGQPNYLDGIPFSISEGGKGDLDAILARIEGHKETLNSVNWESLDYDFGIEKTVINQDITATIRRLHVGRSVDAGNSF